MDDAELARLVGRFDTSNNATRDEVWQRLRTVGDRVLPGFEALLATARRAEIRRDIAFHSIRYARTSEPAFRIGLRAIADRASIVRYRGCCVLAYSLRLDARPALEALRSHADPKSVADALAALDAIEHRNHHYFVDRTHSGSTFWHVNDGDVP